MIYKLDLNPDLMDGTEISLHVTGSFVRSRIDLYKFGDGAVVPFFVAMNADGIDRDSALKCVEAYFKKPAKITGEI